MIPTRRCALASRPQSPPARERVCDRRTPTPVSLARTSPTSQMFDDDTGEALNPAARKLVQEALAADELALEANGGAAPELGPILASIPVVDCAEGTHKYVQVQLSHPDEPGTQRLVVRSYATCRYHAENYMKLMRILARTSAREGRRARHRRRPNTI